jgi:hypothetical protein
MAAVFLGGCAVGGASSQLAVPKAKAQQAPHLTKWEYRCTGPLLNEAYANREVNQLGGEGWEAIAVQKYVDSPGERWCFKRQKI